MKEDMVQVGIKPSREDDTGGGANDRLLIIPINH